MLTQAPSAMLFAVHEHTHRTVDRGHSLLLVLDPAALVAETHELPYDALHLVREPVPLRGRVRVLAAPAAAPGAVLVLRVVPVRRRPLLERGGPDHGRRGLRVARGRGAFVRGRDAVRLELRALLPLLCKGGQIDGLWWEVDVGDGGVTHPT